jgi:hypothetical protein
MGAFDMNRESSDLQILQRKNSWAKRQIKGATSGYMKASEQLGLKQAQLVELQKTILKLETTMLNQLAENYEATKATILWERQTGKKLGVTNSSQ